LYGDMNREYNCQLSSKNSKRLLKNLQNTTEDLFFAAPCIVKYLLCQAVEHFCQAGSCHA